MYLLFFDIFMLLYRSIESQARVRIESHGEDGEVMVRVIEIPVLHFRRILIFLVF